MNVPPAYQATHASSKASGSQLNYNVIEIHCIEAVVGIFTYSSLPFPKCGAFSANWTRPKVHFHGFQSFIEIVSRTAILLLSFKDENVSFCRSVGHLTLL